MAPKDPRPPRSKLRSFEELPPIAQEEVQKEVRRYMQGSTPPPRLEAVERRVREQVSGHDSGVHNVEELVRLLELRQERAAAEQLAEERRLRQEAIQELARVREKADADLREERRLSFERVKMLEDRKEQRWNRKWALIATLVTLIATALITKYVGAPAAGSRETPATAPASSAE